MKAPAAALCASLLLGAAPVPPAPGVDELVARHVAAIGGMAKIQAIRSIVERGQYREGTFHIDTYAAQLRPFYRVIGDPAQALQEIQEGYDGSAWEYYPDPGIVVRTTGAAANATRRATPIDDALVDYKAHGTTLSLGGTRDILGRTCYVLHATLDDGFAEDIFLDTQTSLIDAEQRIVPMHAFGKQYTTLDTYGDYHPDGGVMRPHLFKEIDEETGRALTESVVTSVDVNRELPVAMFHPPQWERTPVQTMIARIYDERTDPQAVLATYRDFAAIVDLHAKSASDAIDFVGYQSLKMGQTATAVALLTKNVEANPNDARAHFGLGRALATSGDKDAARTQYQTALTLDPTMQRAKDGLAQLSP